MKQHVFLSSLTIILLLAFVPGIPRGEIIFQDNFDAHPDWTIRQGTGSCWSGCNVPSGWSGYYNGGSYCSDPGHNNFYISSANARGATGKALTFWDESCTVEFENSDGQLGVDLGRVYSEIYLRYYIKFQPNYQWESFYHDSAPQHKWLHLQYHTGPGIPWHYFGDPTNMPIAVPGINTYFNDVYYYVGYRCEVDYYCQGTPSYNTEWGDATDRIRLGSWSSVFGDNQWHCLEFYFKMNTNNGATFNADGIHRFWLDGVLKHESTRIPFSDNGSTQSPRRGWNYFSIGGNNNNYWNTTCNGTACEQWYAVDDLVISTQYIGPDGGRDTKAPSPPKSLRVR